MLKALRPLRSELLGLLLPFAGNAGAQAYAYPNGSLVADFTVTDVNGEVYSLYDITAQGKYVFLDFFTLGCTPCQETAAHWAELYQTYGCNGGDVVCLSLDYELHTAAEIEAFSDAYGGGWAHPPVVSGALALQDAFGVGNAPNYCLIGPDNVMINNCIWPVASSADLVEALPPGSNVTPHACAVGIVESEEKELTASPNPSNGTIRVNGTNAVGARVHDATGRLLMSAPIIGGQVHLQGHGPGLYTIVLLNAGGTSAGRVRVRLE